MSAPLSRKGRRLLTQQDQRTSRIENGMRKRKERARRETALKEALKNGKFPYTPTVRSWLAHKLNKPARQITQADADAVLKG